MREYLELLGDFLLIVLGGLLIYIFVTIEVLGYYGQEQNVFIRWYEIFLGIPIVALGIYHFISDLRRK